jgi:hypothetical protein
LAALDYRFLLVYDPVDGLRPYPNEPAIVELATRLFDLKLVEGAMPVSLENLIAVMKKVAGLRDARCAMVVDFASRLARSPDHLDANEHRFFVAAERLSLMANPIVPKGADIATANGKARFNPVLWLANRPQDLPGWLSFDSTRVSILPIGLPDFETRERSGPAPRQRIRRLPRGKPRRAAQVQCDVRAAHRRSPAGGDGRYRTVGRSPGDRVSRCRRRRPVLQGRRQ